MELCDKVKKICYSFIRNNHKEKKGKVKMSLDNMQISLEDFIKQLFFKWKTIMVTTVLCTALFVVTAVAAGEEISVPHSEEYLKYEKELEYHETYLEESVLMNLDPTCIYQRSLILRDVSDKEILKNYAVSSEIWDELDTERSKKYISELVKWSENETGTIELTLRHATSEECLSAAEYLKQELLLKDPAVEITIGAEKIVVDEKLQEEHLRWYSRIDYVKSLLLDAQAGFTIKVNVIAAALVGVLFGLIVSVILVLMSYLFNKNRNKL